jgi:hypothetical protein
MQQVGEDDGADEGTRIIGSCHFIVEEPGADPECGRNQGQHGGKDLPVKSTYKWEFGHNNRSGMYQGTPSLILVTTHDITISQPGQPVVNFPLPPVTP